MFQKLFLGRSNSGLHSIQSLCSALNVIPAYNSLNKTSALKVNAALRKFAAIPVQAGRQKPLATHPSCLESYLLELQVSVPEASASKRESYRIPNRLAHIKNLSTPLG